ncbi:MAG: NADH-quinone oxidoreductase subunit N [Thermoanaerobaculia bacterium]|nr:MAG: NADH-quinone oxidoreductase subunit N [Thermoanaerobaculia bacterium]
MNPLFAVPAADLASLAPELLLTAVATVLLLLEAFAPAWRRAFVPAGVAATLGAAWLLAGQATGPAFHGLVEASPLTRAFSLTVLLATALGLLAAPGYLRRARLLAGEYPALLLWCAAGLLLLIRTTELLTLFLALELFSVALYGLAAYHRRSARSAEAGLKYFLMGAFVSSFLLYGVALLFGETGSTRLDGIAAALAAGNGSRGLLVLGSLLVASAFAFKLSLVPFHAWAPDVYQGAPTPFVAFLSVAPKVASAVVLVRLVTVFASSPIGGRWPEVIAFLAVASMLIGNLFALVQRDIKRMLAYSGVAHMGYLMIPLAAPGDATWRPVLVYLVAYVLMNAGAFIVVAMLYPSADDQHPIAGLSGWGYRFPVLGICLTVCMISLGGIPPTAGFIGKYLVFLHAIQHQQLYLALVGITASLIGVVVYLRVVYMLYMKPEIGAPQDVAPDFGGQLAAVVAAAASLLLGLWPALLIDWAVAALPVG